MPIKVVYIDILEDFILQFDPLAHVQEIRESRTLLMSAASFVAFFEGESAS